MLPSVILENIPKLESHVVLNYGFKKGLDNEKLFCSMRVCNVPTIL